MRRAWIALIGLCAWGEELTLKRVLESVERHYPPLLAAMEDRVIAAADVTAAEGRFDVVMKSGWEGDYLGTYRNDVYKAGMEQATQFQGMTYFAGYQMGRGSFAGYDGKQQTDLGGEWKAGVKMPLLRDRAIDGRRAELGKAVLGRRIAELGVEQQRLVIRQMATRKYWDWVAAGRRFEVAREVLEVAEKRDAQLKEAARLGQIPSIDVTDNLRAILTRRGQAIEARRGLEMAAIELSLFVRDDGGAPVQVGAEALPAGFPAMGELDEARLKEDIEVAQARRPEIRRLEAQRGQVEVDRRLARNQRMAGVDVVMSYGRQTGERVVRRGPDDLVASLVFDLAAQRRAAKGKEAAAAAKVAQYGQRERFAREQVEAEVRDAYSAVRAARGRAEVLRAEVEVASELETAERVRFELGEGTLFQVNLREQARFDTAMRAVSAQQEYFRAVALYEFAVAEAARR